MSDWLCREHSKGDIDRAGSALIPWWTGEAKWNADTGSDAFRTVENWLMCHAYPLNAFQVTLRRRARKMERDALIAQRLKRFVSVMNKLAREPNMKLSQMQDLGGCRAIMSDVQAVDRLVEVYKGETDLFSDASAPKTYDYIRSPKKDGYRGIHLVGRFEARTEAGEKWNGQRIEIQIRSRLQHAFATAVETVTTFTRTPLKSGGGPERWRRFFSLMGSALALHEGTQLVENTPDDATELARELKYAARSLRVRRTLQTWARALKTIPRRHIKDAKWLLMVLDLRVNKISVIGYQDRAEAAEALARIERRRSGSRIDAVLVWVPDARHLRAAYPNYYADTTQFLNALDAVLELAR